MTETKLKPCPFCGSADIEYKELSNPFSGDVSWDRVHYLVCCRRCGAVIQAKSYEETIAKWNRRASGWISVEEHLPKPLHRKTIGSCVYYDSDPVAVVAEDDLGERVYGIGTYYVGVEDGKPVDGWDGVTIEDVSLYACEVTHWMPLAKLPEVEK